MQLRAENVLLIDDNLGNLQEATFYCPTLKVALPSVIEELEQELPKVQKMTALYLVCSSIKF